MTTILKEFMYGFVRGCVNSTAVGSVKSVGAPVKSVGTSVETVAEAVVVAVKHGNKFKRYDPGLHSGSWNYEGDNADGNAIVI